MLKVDLVKPEKAFKTHTSVPLQVILTNTGDEDLSVLIWNTPLDPVITDCLEISVDGKKVEYDGPIVKRGAPTAKDYKLIKAGQSIVTDFPVSDAYDTSKPGTYRVKLKTAVPDVQPKRPQMAAMLKAADFKPTKQAIKASTSFKVEKGEGRRLTLGAAARGKEQQKKAAKAATAKAAAKKKPALKTLLTPLTDGGTAMQKTQAKKAHVDGYNLCVAALTNLANNAWYKEWFGTHTTARFNKVKKNYSDVKARMESIQFTYNLTGSGCSSGVFAYTYKGTSTIWFCDQFWAAPASGTDSKAGTVLHEHTHSDASTDDNVYGQAGCRNLAISDPKKAVANADSHEYHGKG